MSGKPPKETADIWNEMPFIPDIRVFEEDAHPIDTGLLDENGTKIFRHPARRAIGFDLSSRGRRS